MGVMLKFMMNTTQNKNKEKAMKFNDLMEISKVWKLVDPRNPIRLDGKPNRPLTAFTIMSETV